MCVNMCWHQSGWRWGSKVSRRSRWSTKQIGIMTHFKLHVAHNCVCIGKIELDFYIIIHHCHTLLRFLLNGYIIRSNIIHPKPEVCAKSCVRMYAESLNPKIRKIGISEITTGFRITEIISQWILPTLVHSHELPV